MLDDTIIDDQVKIGNLVPIAHNVKIGMESFIAGCSAVAGSAKIGRFVQLGCGTRVVGYLTVGDGASGGIAKNVKPGQVLAGLPAIPIRKWHKLNAILLRMAMK